MISDFWVPLSMRDMATSMLPANQLDVFTDRDAKWLFVVGRLPVGGGRGQADAEAKVIAQRLAAAIRQAIKIARSRWKRPDNWSGGTQRDAGVLSSLTLYLEPRTVDGVRQYCQPPAGARHRAQ
jgi:hypothetical protein